MILRGNVYILTIQPIDPSNQTKDSNTGEAYHVHERKNTVTIKGAIDWRKQDDRVGTLGGTSLDTVGDCLIRAVDCRRRGYVPRAGDLLIEIKDRKSGTRSVRLYLENVIEYPQTRGGYQGYLFDLMSRPTRTRIDR